MIDIAAFIAALILTPFLVRYALRFTTWFFKDNL